MMMVNGAATRGVKVWEETVSVLPNTNYSFGYYAQSLTTADSLVLQVSINGGQVIGRTHLSKIPCERQHYVTSWYSDSNTSVTVRITDLDTDVVNNNFALDSISLRALYLKTDSIFVSLIPPPVFSVQPPTATICLGGSVALAASGGDGYSWSPASQCLATFF